MDSSASSSRPHYNRRYQQVADELSPRKSILIIVVVVGCFAVLWPKVFYPMLVGNATQQIKPNAMDRAAGCCDVFSENDIDTIKLMSELCSSIIQHADEKLKGKEIVTRCRKEILETCGIDISAVLQEQIRLGRTVKQILNEVRSLNGSLCLKYHYGVSPSRLGVGHRVHGNVTDKISIKQERPPNVRPESIHPAFRERGSAIPQPRTAAADAKRKNVRIVEGRPGPVPGMRPTIGGPGHVVQASQKSGGMMGVLMPVYTIGIVIFFTYTLMKLVMKKDNTGVRGNLYPPVDPDPRFRQEVFESERCRYKPRLSRDPSGRIVVNAMSALLDEVNQEIEARRKANELKNQGKDLANGDLAKDQEQTSVKVLGMETTASCEGGERWNKNEPAVAPVVPKIEVAPPQEIYLEGALPAQSQILVTDSETVTQITPSSSDPAVVLAGKMTLSVISLDNAQEEGADGVNGEVVNGDETAEDVEESKYTTASSATAAEHDISEGTDEEGENGEVGRINELDFDVNHVDEFGDGSQPLAETRRIEETINGDGTPEREIAIDEKFDDEEIPIEELGLVEDSKEFVVVKEKERSVDDVQERVDDVQERIDEELDAMDDFEEIEKRIQEILEKAEAKANEIIAETEDLAVLRDDGGDAARREDFEADERESADVRRETVDDGRGGEEPKVDRNESVDVRGDTVGDKEESLDVKNESVNDREGSVNVTEESVNDRNESVDAKSET